MKGCQPLSLHTKKGINPNLWPCRIIFWKFCLGQPSACGLLRTPKATPIKYLHLDDTSGQLKLEGWLYIIIFIVYTLFHEEAPFYWQFERGTILLKILERRPFYWLFSEMRHHLLGKFWRMLKVGLSFILRSMLYLEDWSSRSSYFIGVA